MKNNIFKSFRFEIVLYSLLSLIYSILTEALLIFGVYLINYFIKLSEKTNQYGNSLDGSTNRIITNNGYINQKIPESDTLTSSLPFAAKVGGGVFICMIVGILVIGVVLFIAYFLLLTRKFGTYIEKIANGITAISAGDFDTRITIQNEDEFAIIADKLNHMADDIKTIIDNDRKSENTKNQLITSVAHDLRTPLTSIIGYLGLVIEEDRLTPDIKNHYIEIAYNKSKRLEKLIEDLFAYTKFSSGEVTMNLSDIDMIKFIDQLADEFYPSFQENGLKFEFTSNENTAFVLADGDLLARAFANLIDNAIKYGKDGKSVRINLYREDGKINIAVINYGRLIPEKDLLSIFERFYRLEVSRSSETGGTGLGLAIAKNIILMHGGSIEAHSDFSGTVFLVSLDEKKERLS